MDVFDELRPVTDYIRFTVTMMAVIDPFLAVPIFLSYTSGNRAVKRKQIVNTVSIAVFAVLVGSAIFGEQLLLFIGASLSAFRVGGGLVLLLMALAMLNAEVGGVRQSTHEAEVLESGELPGVVPLAVPLLAGPGAISSTIIATQAGGVTHAAIVILCIGVVSLITWGTLRLAAPIGAIMGISGLNIATRLLGLLLAALAIQTMARGLIELFPGLA